MDAEGTKTKIFTIYAKMPILMFTLLKGLALSYSPQKLLFILLNPTHKPFSMWMIWSNLPNHYMFQFLCLYVIEIINC